MSGNNGFFNRIEISTDDITYQDVAPLKDATLSISKSKLDCTSKQDNGYKQWLGDHVDGVATFQVIRDETENAQNVLKQDANTPGGTTLYFKIYPEVGSGLDLYTGTFFVETWDEQYPLEDIQMVDVALQLSGLTLTSQP